MEPTLTEILSSSAHHRRKKNLCNTHTNRQNPATGLLSLIFFFCFVSFSFTSIPHLKHEAAGGDHMLSLRGRRLKINRVKSSARESDYGPVWAGRRIVLPRSLVYLPSRRLVRLFWLFSFPLPISRVTLARRPRPEERACVPPPPAIPHPSFGVHQYFIPGVTFCPLSWRRHLIRRADLGLHGASDSGVAR